MGILDITQELLKFEIKATTISNKATVAKTKNIIEDHVVIDDFAKIVHIGKQFIE
ncbi:MAG: hypothetical protein P0116_06615 [Candidatus Nitrosocosmicus sp.]|nr:hypothetical protein [Candidatus Nitrosocosmicus sp.]